jgi:hypothetical protein
MSEVTAIVRVWTAGDRVKKSEPWALSAKTAVPATATTVRPLLSWPPVDAVAEMLDKATLARHTPEDNTEHVIVVCEVLKPAFDSGVGGDQGRVPQRRSCCQGGSIEGGTANVVRAW